MIKMSVYLAYYKIRLIATVGLLLAFAVAFSYFSLAPNRSPQGSNVNVEETATDVSFSQLDQKEKQELHSLLSASVHKAIIEAATEKLQPDRKVLPLINKVSEFLIAHKYGVQETVVVITGPVDSSRTINAEDVVFGKLTICQYKVVGNISHCAVICRHNKQNMPLLVLKYSSELDGEWIETP